MKKSGGNGVGRRGRVKFSDEHVSYVERRK